MKKLIYTLCAILTLGVSSCKYDDSDLWNSVNDLDKRVTKLEEICNQLNANVNALQTIVNSMDGGDYITNVTSLYEGDTLIGYKIDFANSPSITIYHGKNGSNGNDGLNGSNGTDGYTPLIGVAQDTDGHYYWTIDGNWLLDNNGNKVLAEGMSGRDGQNGSNGNDGADGITPQFKI